MKDIMMPCPYCDSNVTVKFPCCGYLCMRCGKSFEEEDVKENKVPSVQGTNPNV